jgi:hypothetical protein
MRPSTGILTDMVNGTSTEFSKEFLSTKCSEILNDKWPQMKYVVPWDTIPLFYYHNLCPQQLCFYSSAKATGSCSNNQNLQPTKLSFNTSNYKYINLHNGSQHLLIPTLQHISVDIDNMNMNFRTRTLLCRQISVKFCMQILFHNSQNETDALPPITSIWGQSLTITYHVKDITTIKKGQILHQI